MPLVGAIRIGAIRRGRHGGLVLHLLLLVRGPRVPVGRLAALQAVGETGVCDLAGDGCTKDGLNLDRVCREIMKNVRGELGAGLGCKDFGSHDGGLGNLNDFGIVLSLSGDPGCRKSIGGLRLPKERNILERTVVGRVTTSVFVTSSVAVTYCV